MFWGEKLKVISHLFKQFANAPGQSCWSGSGRTAMGQLLQGLVILNSSELQVAATGTTTAAADRAVGPLNCQQSPTQHGAGNNEGWVKEAGCGPDSAEH